jgi:hypothetical protein
MCLPTVVDLMLVTTRAGRLQKEKPSRSSRLFERVIQTCGDPASGHHALAKEHVEQARCHRVNRDVRLTICQDYHSRFGGRS